MVCSFKSYAAFIAGLLFLISIKAQPAESNPRLDLDWPPKNQSFRMESQENLMATKKGELIFRVAPGQEENIFTFSNLTELESLKAQGLPEYLQNLYQYFGVRSVEKAFKIQTERLQRYYKLTFTKYSLQRELLESLKNIPGIEHVEEIPIYQLFSRPDDIHPTQWGLSRINALGAWAQATGRKKVVVAIVDDAVRITHQDLKDIIYRNPNEIPDNGIDDDQNGYIDDVNGWDAGDNDNNPNPPARAADMVFSHGTHCAGIAGAATNNGKGIASIGHNISILPVKAADSTSSGTGITDGYPGVQYAIIAGADVISMSWGGGLASQAVQDLLNYAHSIGIVLVAAAGNNNQNQRFYPCAYNNVICVASTDFSDKKSEFSNYGTWVDVSAPGEYIYSTVATHDSAYFYYDGTSMATPMVAGLCGLMKSYNPSLTPAQIESCLKSTADNIDALNPNFRGLLGAGRINASAALGCAAPLALDLGFAPRIQGGVATLCEPLERLTLTLFNGGSQEIRSFTLRYSIGGGAWQEQTITQSIPSGEEYGFVMPLPTLAPGGYEIRAEIVSVNNQPDPNPANNTLSATLRISKIENIACGGRFTGTTRGAPSLNSRYNCNANRNESGPEVYHRIIITEKGILGVTLSGAANNTNAYLLSGCTPNQCLGFGPGNFNTLVDPGVYYIVVENPNAQGTNYTLAVSCQPLLCNTPATGQITCGTPIQAQLSGTQNIFSAYGCGPVAQNAAERVYRLVLPQSASIAVRITSANATVRAFVLNACDPASCLGFAVGSPLAGNQILNLNNLALGEYFIVVDGAQNGNFTLLVNCTDCSSAIPLTCGAPYSGTTVGGTNAIATYSCFNQNLNGPERIHHITVTEAGTIRVRLQNANANMRALLLENCSSQRCLGITATEMQVFVPGPGTYPIVVDATTAASAGAYELTVDCLPYRCPTPVSLTCGQTYNGNTSTGVSNVSRYSCANWFLPGPEVLHSIQISSPSIITAALSNQSANQDVFILDACNPARCIAFGDNTASAMVETPGTYYIMVDGAQAGTYRLQVNCTPLNCGTTAIDVQCGARYQGTTATSRNTRTTYPCLPGINFGAPEVVHRIRVTERANLIARMQPANAQQQYVMFWQSNCSPASCINFGLGQLQLMNVEPGEYFLVVDAQAGTQGDYTLLITCENLSCNNAVPLACGQDIEYRGNTTGKRRSSTFYPCKPASFSFGGEEVLVFRPEFSGYVELQFRSQATQGALDLFLLSGCNAATCMGYWPAAQPVNEKIYVEAGQTYYVVVDGGVQGQNVVEGPFTLKIKCPCPEIRIKGPGSSVCPGQAFELSAEGYGGAIRWYNNASAAAPSFVGNVYRTSATNSPARFFAEPDAFCAIIQRASIAIEVAESPSLEVNPTAGRICQGQSITLRASGNGERYTWNPPVGLNTTSGAVVVAAPQNSVDYTVTAQKTGVACSAQRTISVAVTPNPQPEIYQQQDFIYVRNFQEGIQWLRNGAPIPGATAPQYQVTQTGWYAAEVTDLPSGCKGRSDSLFVQPTGIQDRIAPLSFACYPNPASGVVTLSFSFPLPENAELLLYNALGQKVGSEKLQANTLNYSFHIAHLPNGIYTIAISQSGKERSFYSILKTD
jgi:hypothetical protein